MNLEILLTSPWSMRIWAISPVSSLLIVYVALMIYIFKAKSSNYRNALVVVNLLTVWSIVKALLRNDGFYRYIGFTIRDGLIFYVSAFLIVTMGSTYFGLLRELRRPNSHFRGAYAVMSLVSLCAVFTLLFLLEIGPDLNPNYPYWQPSEVIT